MTARHDEPALVDTLLLPTVWSRTSPVGWLRRVATFVLWAALSAAFAFMPPLLGTAYNVALAVAFVWWFARRPGLPARRRSTYRIRPIGPAARWLPTIAALLVAFVAASVVVASRLLPAPEENAFIEAYLRQPWAWLGLLSATALVAPLLEEFLFRGWLQRSLERRVPARTAIVATALTFALAHFDTFGLLPRLAFALAAGTLAWSTRSIWPGVLLHAAYNASVLGLGAAFPGVDRDDLLAAARDPRWLSGAVAVLAVSGALLAWSTGRAVAVARPGARARARPNAG